MNFIRMKAYAGPDRTERDLLIAVDGVIDIQTSFGSIKIIYDTVFLTNNAENLMDINRTNACQKNCCGPCQKPYNIGTMLPEQNISKCTSSVCGTLVTNPNGLGTGRQYSQDTGICANWPESLPYNQPKDCCTPAKNNFNYYPYDRKQVAMNRLTSPGGGVALTGGDSENYN